MDQVAQAVSNQQQTGGQVLTGNPQQVPSGASLQSSTAQNGGSLQSAGVSSIDAIRALDQGGKPITVSGVSNNLSLPFSNTTTTSVQPATSPSKRNETAAYISIGLVVVACIAVLAWGLLKPRKYKPER